MEEVFVNKNPQSTLKLAQARGAVLAACGAAGLPVAEHAARLVKKAVVGTGAAEKAQVQAMLKVLLPGVRAGGRRCRRCAGGGDCRCASWDRSRGTRLMFLVVFRNRKRADIDGAAYAADAARMEELAREQPGFLSFKSYTADDGEVVAISEWDERSQRAWLAADGRSCGGAGAGARGYYAELHRCSPATTRGAPVSRRRTAA